MHMGRRALEKWKEWELDEYSFFEKIIHFCWSNRLQTLHDHSSGVNFLPESFIFAKFFSASNIFVKLLFIWAGLVVFPFNMMKKRSLPSCSAC